mmetsp:Transcript_104135/g.269647  ORF Transcript_104135/g.269647 Transcript_104135/m.269647 type:complete len:234 (+) Transcript_104135:319-1020(+)
MDFCRLTQASAASSGRWPPSPGGPPCKQRPPMTKLLLLLLQLHREGCCCRRCQPRRKPMTGPRPASPPAHPPSPREALHPRRRSRRNCPELRRLLRCHRCHRRCRRCPPGTSRHRHPGCPGPRQAPRPPSPTRSNTRTKRMRLGGQSRRCRGPDQHHLRHYHSPLGSGPRAQRCRRHQHALARRCCLSTEATHRHLRRALRPPHHSQRSACTGHPSVWTSCTALLDKAWGPAL